jgi:hypothetical protein
MREMNDRASEARPMINEVDSSQQSDRPPANSPAGGLPCEAFVVDRFLVLSSGVNRAIRR